MRILRALAGVLVLGLLAAGASRAGSGEKPHIEKTDALDNLYQGTTMTVGGTGFGTDPKAVKVTLGSDTFPAMSVLPTEVLFQVPPKASVGRRQLSVDVGGSKSNALDVEVRDRKDRPKREDGGRGGPASTIHMDPPVMQADHGMFQIAIVGKAEYPNDSVIFLTLMPGSGDDKRAVSMGDAIVKDGFFRTSFDLKGRALFPAFYYVHAEFKLEKQPSSVRTAFRNTFTKPEDVAAHEHGEDKKPLKVGDPETGLQEMHEHFATTLRRVRALTDDLEDGFASAGRSMFRGKDGKVDEVAWEAWLQQWPYQAMDATTFRARTAAVRKGLRFLASNSMFEPDAWRSWMDGVWRDGLTSLAHDHAAFKGRYQFAPCDDAAEKLSILIGDLMRLSQKRSQEIYDGNHLDTPAADKEQQKDPALRVAGSGPVSRPILEKDVRDIAKMAGLTETLEVAPPLK